MSDHLPSLMELRETDAMLDQLADRRTPTGPAAHDPVLSLLATLADAVDAQPLPELPAARVTRAVAPHRSSARARHLGVLLAVGLTLSTTGIAAAVTGDPLRPIKAVVKHLYEVGREPDPQTNWILGSGRSVSHADGSGSSMSVEQLVRSVARHQRASHAMSAAGLPRAASARPHVHQRVANDEQPGAGGPGTSVPPNQDPPSTPTDTTVPTPDDDTPQDSGPTPGDNGNNGSTDPPATHPGHQGNPQGQPPKPHPTKPAPGPKPKPEPTPKPDPTPKPEPGPKPKPEPKPVHEPKPDSPPKGQQPPLPGE